MLKGVYQLRKGSCPCCTSYLLISEWRVKIYRVWIWSYRKPFKYYKYSILNYPQMRLPVHVLVMFNNTAQFMIALLPFTSIETRFQLYMYYYRYLTFNQVIKHIVLNIIKWYSVLFDVWNSVSNCKKHMLNTESVGCCRFTWHTVLHAVLAIYWESSESGTFPSIYLSVRTDSD